MATSLNDQAVLSTDPGFIQRVRTAIIAAAIAISNEGAVTLHAQRDTVAVGVVSNPNYWQGVFAAAVATDATASGQATVGGTVVLTAANVAVQAALITDLAITSAVSAQWNSFFAH